MLLIIDPTASYAGTGYDELYCADANLGLVKFYFNGTTWIFAGNFNPATIASGGMYALTAWQNDAGNPQIYAIKGATANNEIMMLTDVSGFTGSILTTPPTATVVTTAGANFMFRGIAFTPGQLPVLPLTITTFNAALVTNNAHLAWTTAAELNAKAFEVERSTDDTNFKPIGQVAATNRSNGSSYIFIDKDLKKGTNCYRLKAIDKDGSFKYSKIVAF